MKNSARLLDEQAPTQAEAGGVRLIWSAPFEMRPGHVGRHPGFRSWLLELVTHGRMEVRTPAFDWQRLAAGGGALYPPGCRYEERVAPGNAACRSLCVLFGPGDAAGAPFDSDVAMLVRDPDSSAQRLARTISETYLGDGAQRLVAQGCMMQLVGQMQLAGRSGRELLISPATSGEHELVARADAFMREHLARSCRVGDIARHVGMSASGLSHAYKRLAGRTPMHALRSFRIEAARTLVLRDQLSLEQIAEQTGFADAFHLSRTFKQVTGQTPRDYRRARLYTRES